MAKKPQQTQGGTAAKSSAKPGAKDAAPVERLIIHNKKLRFDYSVLESWEAGLVLMGSEVKSLRNGDVQWGDAHARIDERDGQLWLYGLHIMEYRFASHFGHQPIQPRKLLLNRVEIDRIRGKLDGKGLTLAPERLFFKGKYVKVVLCLCQGKSRGDKRQDLMAKAQQRDVEREMARRLKRG